LDGTNWLGFGHIVIALFFIGPLIDPISARANMVPLLYCLTLIRSLEKPRAMIFTA
jgi:hypothetical protein